MCKTLLNFLCWSFRFTLHIHFGTYIRLLFWSKLITSKVIKMTQLHRRYYFHRQFYYESLAMKYVVDELILAKRRCSRNNSGMQTSERAISGNIYIRRVTTYIYVASSLGRVYGDYSSIFFVTSDVFIRHFIWQLKLGEVAEMMVLLSFQCVQGNHLRCTAPPPMFFPRRCQRQ